MKFTPFLREYLGMFGSFPMFFRKIPTKTNNDGNVVEPYGVHGRDYIHCDTGRDAHQ
jgi:hypothetical protein